MDNGDFFPNAFRAGKSEKYIAIEFGKTDVESGNLADSDVSLLCRVMISPSQVGALIANLIAEGADYQKRTGEDIGFSPLLKLMESGGDGE